jgi:hypothetical protein
MTLHYPVGSVHPAKRMSKNSDESGRTLLLNLAASDMALARMFVEAARSAYSRGDPHEGEFARLRAMKSYEDALRSVVQLAEPVKESISSDLQHLRAQIEWLSTRTDATSDISPKIDERPPSENVSKLVDDKS